MTPEEFQSAFYAPPPAAPWCFFCEDRVARGYLVLVYRGTGKAVPRRRGDDRRRPPVCGWCRFETHGAEGVPDGRGRATRWRFVAFSGKPRR